MKTNLLLLCLSLTACQSLVGSGTVTTTTREVSAFRRVAIASGLRANASTGSRALFIRADDNLQGFIETLVEGDTLIVRLKSGTTVVSSSAFEASIHNDLFEGVDASGGAHVTLAATPVSSYLVNASGGSLVEVTGLSSPDLNVNASGGSTVKLEGSATSGTAHASGASTVRLTDVPLERLRVEASGASSIHARVSATLTGNASGASTITIAGNPSNQVETSGGSRVQLNAP